MLDYQSTARKRHARLIAALVVSGLTGGAWAAESAPPATEPGPAMVEANLPWIQGEAPQRRESRTINPRTSDFFEVTPEAQPFMRDANGMVRAPVYRTLEAANQAGVNPRKNSPLPEVAPTVLNDVEVRPLWVQVLGWLGLAAIVLAVPAGIWATRRGR